MGLALLAFSAGVDSGAKKWLLRVFAFALIFGGVSAAFGP